MLTSLLNGGNVTDIIVSLMLSVPIIFLALSVHETAHGYVAYKLGDPTAHSLGRLTLNPIKHIDILGFICMLVAGFGWAKPVPINSRYFKKPKRDMALTALAGPLSNLLLAVVFALILKGVALLWNFLPPSSEITLNIYTWSFKLITIGIRMNVVFAVFNMLPVPPFDGSRIFLTFLPSNTYFKIMRYEQYIQIAIMLALVLGFLDRPLAIVSNFVLNIIL
jgi:Zn-dependent protease